MRLTGCLWVATGYPATSARSIEWDAEEAIAGSQLSLFLTSVGFFCGYVVAGTSVDYLHFLFLMYEVPCCWHCMNCYRCGGTDLSIIFAVTSYKSTGTS